MRVLAEATGSLVHTLRGGMGNVGNEASVGKTSKQEPGECRNEIFDFPPRFAGVGATPAPATNIA